MTVNPNFYPFNGEQRVFGRNGHFMYLLQRLLLSKWRSFKNELTFHLSSAKN